MHIRGHSEGRIFNLEICCHLDPSANKLLQRHIYIKGKTLCLLVPPKILEDKVVHSENLCLNGNKSLTYMKVKGQGGWLQEAASILYLARFKRIPVSSSQSPWLSECIKHVIWDVETHMVTQHSGFLYRKRLWLINSTSGKVLATWTCRPSLMPRTCAKKQKIKTKTSGVVAHACGTSSREVKTGSSWDIMASHLE